jgi:hypothetical protein
MYYFLTLQFLFSCLKPSELNDILHFVKKKSDILVGKLGVCPTFGFPQYSSLFR